ncbi:MAG: hypothetical protein JNL92_06190 [Opitutaceae bacterium]|nr:hypothetical protein [Opitutaceae bacterium]
MKSSPLLLAFAALMPGAAIVSAQSGPVTEAAALATTALPTPAATGSQCSNLTTGADGTVYLTWSEPGAVEGEKMLRLATLSPGAAAWSAPRTIVRTPLLMENWADFASLVVGTDGALTAQWFQRSAPDGHGYEGWFARSSDRGATWSQPARLGHEFVALAPLSGGRTLAVWLESARQRDPNAVPRAKRDPKAPRPARDPNAPYAPSMKLLARLLAPDGRSLGEWTVDPDVCTCCQNTVATLPGDRVFVAYRGHTADEIRDNRYALFADGRWSASQTLQDDGWKIAACPVNGPAADAHGESLAVAWFTAANGVAKVQARSSSDGGRTLGAAVRVDLGRPMGRIETVMLADRSAVFLWMETGTAENAAGIYARRLWPDGTLSAPRLVASSTQARTSGFPRAALRPDGRVVMSWTQTSPANSVKTLAFDPAALPRAATNAISFAPKGGGPPGIRLEYTALASPEPVRRGPPVVLELCAAPLTTISQHP